MPPGGTRRTLRSLLAAETGSSTEQDAERGTLTRLLRAADLAGHDVEDVLRPRARGDGTSPAPGASPRSCTAGSSGSSARRNRWRHGGYADRTPAIEDPEADRFARELAAAMDERVSLLGNRVAMDRPVWALRYLGEVPADPVERAEWIRRAGLAAAYREERGYADETEAIGPAPERGSPEQRASWHAAYTALRTARRRPARSPRRRDGELWARRAAYERDTAWAPPYVADELRDAHLAEDTYRADAVRAWHRADAATGVSRAGASPAAKPGTTARWPRKSAPTARH